MSNEADKRSVTTDALTTLGTIIDDQQKRDAIHLAVEPVIADGHLVPGQDIRVERGVAYSTRWGDKKPMGIVDPFLPKPVQPGERFWFIMYPRQVRSLRHVWSHPDFPDEVGTEKPAALPAKDKATSEAWLRAWCQANDCPRYETVLAKILDREKSPWDDDAIHFDGQDAHATIPDEFWDHIEIVTGETFERKTHFTCSC